MEEIIVANLTLDTYQRNKVSPLVVPQGDYGARVIRAKVTDLGKTVIVESTAAVSIVATRSGDGESQAFSGSVNADGTVTVPVTQWMLDVPEEDVTCHIVVTGIGYQYSTTSFLIEPQAKATPTEIAPDDPRQDLVTEVLAGENTRRAAEAERVSNENARIAAENARQSSETQRLTDESTRITNEAQRVSAEASRDATFRSWAADIASLPTFDGRISANRKRIENLESGIPAEAFIIDDSVAYTKDVPENVAPNAVVTRIGGMTYKSKNLIPFPYTEGSRTESGVTITVNNDGGFLINGTATRSIFFKLNDVVLDAGTYTLNPTANFNLSTQTIQAYVLVNGEYHWGNASFTIAERATAEVMIRFLEGGGATNGVMYVMFNEGSAKPYEPYYEGLRSAKVTEVKSVGVNLWDEEWEVGGLNADNGDIYYATDRIRGVNYCHCLPNTQYWVPPYIHLVFYNKDKSYVGQVSGNNVITTPDKAYYFKVCGTVGYGTTYNNDIIIAKSTTALPYTPYVEHTLPIPEAVRPANGINENVYDFIEWAEDGSVKKTVKCGVVDLGTLDWKVKASGSVYAPYFYADFYGVKYIGSYYTNVYPLITAPYKTVDRNSLADKCITGDGIDYEVNQIQIKDTTYPDVASFKAAMSGVMLVYELAEPIVTDISDLITADNLVPVQSGGTMTPVNEYSYAVPSTIIYQSR